jgi:hypothetical protein
VFIVVIVSEPVTTFDAADVSVTNGTLSDFLATSSTYTFVVTPSAEGTTTVSIPANSFSDAAGNGNALAQLSFIFATTTQDTEASTTSDVPPASPVSTGGGGGGGGGGSGSGGGPPITPVPSATVAAAVAAVADNTPSQSGAVLGAQSYHFATYLARGQDGEAVLNLQKLLIALGLLQDGAAVGHFGPLTQAAVRAYQKAHGIMQTGTVGPLTRAALNKETVPF